MNDVIDKIKLLNIEDFIWLVYFFIVLASVASNKLERLYYHTNNSNYKNLAGKITSAILFIAFFIYLYFVFVNFKNVSDLKKYASNKEVRIAFENLIASLLFLVGGALALYADYDTNTDVNLAII